MTEAVDTSKEAVERFAAPFLFSTQKRAAMEQKSHGAWVRYEDYATLLAERDQLRREVEEALKSADKLGYHCVGCGHLCGNPVKDLEILRKSGARSCCPEREMEPLSEAIRALKARP